MSITTYSCASDKVKVVYDYITHVYDKEQVQCLIIVGAGGSGKSMAINEAMDKLTDDDEINVSVWNQAEFPQFMRPYTENYLDKWIICRWSDDAFTQSLVEDWGDRCKVVNFERGDEAEL